MRFLKAIIIIMFISLFIFPIKKLGIYDILISKYIELMLATILAGIVSFIFRKTPFQIPKLSLGFFVSLLYVVICSFSSKYSVANLYFHISIIILTFIIFAKIYDNSSLTSIYVILTIIGLFESVYGCFQLFSSNLGYGIMGHFYNQVGFSATLTSLFPFALFLAHPKNENKKNQALGLLTAIIIFVAIILSKSRTGLLASSICFIFFIIKNYKLCYSKKTSFIKIILILFLTSFIVFLFYSLYKNKEDSANGRLLIWQCTINMISKKPMLGYGTNSFNAHYMLHQAQFFESSQNNKFQMLADNVSSPYNEYLNIASQYGVIGLLIFLILYFLITIKYFRKIQHNMIAPFFSLLSIMIFAFFSYPFSFSVILVLLTINTFIITYKISIYQHIDSLYRFSNLLIVGIFIYSTFMTITHINIQRNIAKIRYAVIHGEVSTINTQTLPKHLNKNPYLLYNFALLLNQKNNYYQSTNLLLKCVNYLNDYDVAILLTDNYFKAKNYIQAEKWALLSSEMCPNRFVPLYYLISIYANTNRLEDALDLCAITINKPIKIHSADVHKIKIFAQNFLKTNHL